MKNIAIIALDGMLGSSVSDLLDTVRAANIFIGERLGQDGKSEQLIDNKPARFAWHILSLDGHKPADMGPWVRVEVDGALAESAEPYNMVLVPALAARSPAAIVEGLARYQPLYGWLRSQWQRGASIAAVETGTVLLAESGLLDGRTAATCGWLRDLFSERYPAVHLAAAAAGGVSEQDHIYCAAALSLTTPLSLRLLDRFLTSDITNLLEKSLFSNTRGDVQAPGVALPGLTGPILDIDDELVARAQYWFQRNMAEKVTLADAAESMLVSGKTLARHFKRVLGITPHAYLQGIRIDTAKSFLLHTDLPVETIAERVGYRDVAFFQQVFRSQVGLTPLAFRRRGQAEKTEA
jgi:transcriptional regulator GlxA family with amidase domain